MKKLFFLISALTMIGTGEPVFAHGGHHNHHYGGHNDCHTHVKKGFTHCHWHWHGGPGNGHHGKKYLNHGSRRHHHHDYHYHYITGFEILIK